MKLAMPVVSMVPVKTRPMAVCAAVMLAVVTFCVAAAASKAAKNTLGSLPRTRAVIISVNGVMLAIAVVPVPETSVCSLVPSNGLVICKTQGSCPSAIVKVKVPLASVVAVPVPTLHLPLTVAPAMAKPVAAVPVTESVVDVGVLGGVDEPPPPPQAVSAAMNNEAVTPLKTLNCIDSP